MPHENEKLQKKLVADPNVHHKGVNGTLPRAPQGLITKKRCERGVHASPEKGLAHLNDCNMFMVYFFSISRAARPLSATKIISLHRARPLGATATMDTSL